MGQKSGSGTEREGRREKTRRQCLTLGLKGWAVSFEVDKEGKGISAEGIAYAKALGSKHGLGWWEWSAESRSGELRF